MGMDLEVLASHFRERRGEMLPTASLRFDRDPEHIDCGRRGPEGVVDVQPSRSKIVIALLVLTWALAPVATFDDARRERPAGARGGAGVRQTEPSLRAETEGEQRQDDRRQDGDHPRGRVQTVPAPPGLCHLESLRQGYARCAQTAAIATPTNYPRSSDGRNENDEDQGESGANRTSA